MRTNIYQKLSVEVKVGYFLEHVLRKNKIKSPIKSNWLLFGGAISYQKLWILFCIRPLFFFISMNQGVLRTVKWTLNHFNLHFITPCEHSEDRMWPPCSQTFASMELKALYCLFFHLNIFNQIVSECNLPSDAFGFHRQNAFSLYAPNHWPPILRLYFFCSMEQTAKDIFPMAVSVDLLSRCLIQDVPLANLPTPSVESRWPHHQATLFWRPFHD